MELLHTPLYHEHIALNARMIPFDGFSMPVQYTGIIEEHMAVRRRVGMFDVSHMGEIELLGRDALRFSDYLLTNSLGGMRDGDIRYSPMCYPDGGQVDDLFVCRLGEERVLLVVNASPDHSARDFEWIRGNSNWFDVKVVNRSREYAAVAVQGPLSVALLDPLVRAPLRISELGRFKCCTAQLFGKQILVSRTGYTGEDGYEMLCEPDDAPILWRELLDTGKAHGIMPCGLGARDTLRFEMCYWLYGNDIDETITPLETGQSWAVRFDKDDFIGREALQRIKMEGVKRKLTGLRLLSGGIARNGMKVTKEGSVVGFVTSGNYCPSLQGVYAMALLNVKYTDPGTDLTVIIRDREAPARVVTMPFVAPVHKR